MKRKLIVYSEAAYILGLLTLALGTAFMERADFGMSMVVAPAYLFHLKISESLSWFSFGVAEYCFQAILLLFTALLVRKFKPMFLFSFVTALIYGNVLDLFMGLIGRLPDPDFTQKIFFFILGMLICAIGVSLLFHTYIAPEAYELLVKEASAAFHMNIGKTKTIYDCISCLFSILLSFLFFGFGHFEGVKFGTIICACLNGWLIHCFSKLYDHIFSFHDFFRKR